MSDAADILRRAADVLEQAADGAYRPPWRPDDCHVWTESHSEPDEGPTVYVNGGHYLNQRHTASYIALVDPTVGTALAAWLRGEAEASDASGWPGRPSALAVARALLKEADDE